LNGLLVKLKESEKELSDRKAELESMSVDTVAAIELAFEQIRIICNQREKELLEECKQIEKKKVRTLNKQTDLINDACAEIKYILKSSQEAGDVHNIANVATLMSNSLKQLKDGNVKVEVENASFGVKDMGNKEILDMTKKLGEVFMSEHAGSGSDVEEKKRGNKAR